MPLQLDTVLRIPQLMSYDVWLITVNREALSENFPMEDMLTGGKC
jgi:hypothetical protein